MNYPCLSPNARRAAVLTATLLSASALTARADEGMWLYNDPPETQTQKAYGVTLSDA